MEKDNEGSVRVERPVRRCANCRHWLRLVDTEESWGMCIWYTQRPSEQVIPYWLTEKITRYANNNVTGAISPDAGKTCETFLERTKDA